VRHGEPIIKLAESFHQVICSSILLAYHHQLQMASVIVVSYNNFELHLFSHFFFELLLHQRLKFFKGYIQIQWQLQTIFWQ